MEKWKPIIIIVLVSIYTVHNNNEEIWEKRIDNASVSESEFVKFSINTQVLHHEKQDLSNAIYITWVITIGSWLTETTHQEVH